MFAKLVRSAAARVVVRVDDPVVPQSAPLPLVEVVVVPLVGSMAVLVEQSKQSHLKARRGSQPQVLRKVYVAVVMAVAIIVRSHCAAKVKQPLPCPICTHALAEARLSQGRLSPTFAAR